MARIFGLEVLHMADADVLPYDYVNYGKEIAAYLETAKKKAGPGMDFGPAMAAAARFSAAASAVGKRQTAPSGDLVKLNLALRDTETAFISEAGLPNRPWYLHTIFAPGEFTGYAAVVIPGVNEAIDAKNVSLAVKQLAVLTDAIDRAAAVLEGAE